MKEFKIFTKELGAPLSISSHISLIHTSLVSTVLVLLNSGEMQ